MKTVLNAILAIISIYILFKIVVFTLGILYQGVIWLMLIVGIAIFVSYMIMTKPADD